MARRGLTSQQNNREKSNRVFVQPYPKLCPNLMSFTTVLTKQTNSPCTMTASVLDEGDNGQQGTNHASVHEEHKELQKRYVEM